MHGNYFRLLVSFSIYLCAVQRYIDNRRFLTIGDFNSFGFLGTPFGDTLYRVSQKKYPLLKSDLLL